ncbi:hypothetical protein [Adhaeribacter radiodurans]|uniref:Uncharacterized protein n=1 Tax=Adhaeribacter radiodurans TaxID=2745197 RepID=A0A7L7LBI8_9BACT|nr:hypothetical protein [Adhaeribacter radiodurans]QMU29759.1 hypothetical protein HUW48_17785 [Adhaeribacter radiodurans]
MTLYNFNKGSHQERTILIGQHGTFLADRPGNQYRVCLYHMGEFYAEAYYQVKNNRLELVRGFKNQEFLEPYLDKIILPDIC